MGNWLFDRQSQGGRLAVRQGSLTSKGLCIMKSIETGGNFITPIKSWKEEGNSFNHKVRSITSNEDNFESISGTGSIPFQDVFRTAVDQVKTTQADVENKQYLLATGQLEDAHSLPIAEAKAQVSLDMLISLRNKAIESYNELIKMNI
jgi:flagellar hook-basal body complex protein FliE